MTLQLYIPCITITLYQHLCKTIESWNTELLTVYVFGMVGTQIGRITIAHTNDTSITLQTERQHRTGIRNDTSFSILYFDGDDSHIPSV